jgi:hypothetical protein
MIDLADGFIETRMGPWILAKEGNRVPTPGLVTLTVAPRLGLVRY